MTPIKITSEMLLPLIDAGLTQKQISAKLGVAHRSVGDALRRTGLYEKFWEKRVCTRKKQPTNKAIEFLKLFEDGKTHSQIAEMFGLHKNTVRDTLTRYFGEGLRGGRTVRAIERRRNHEIHLNARYIEKYGHDFETHKAVRKFDSSKTESQQPVEAYRKQRIGARKRGIEWHFTFASWWKLWSESGKWSRRGLGYGFCMCRYMDQGPYSPDNCYISTAVENTQLYYDLNSIAAPFRRAK